MSLDRSVTLCGEQCLDIDGSVGRHGVQAVGRGDDVSCLAVLEDEFDAVGRILWVARDVGSACLEHAEERKHQSAGAWQQQGHAVTLAHSPLPQCGGDAVGGMVHLGVAVLGVDGHQSIVVGLRLGKVVDAVVEEREGCIARRRLSQMAQLLFLPRADDGQLSHAGLGLCSHRLGYGGDALGESLAQLVAVDGVVILHDHAPRFNLDVDLELGHIELEQLLCDRVAAHGVLREHTHLVGIGDGGTEAIVVGDASERIVLVAQRLVEGVACLTQESSHGHVVDGQSQRQGVDKHAHRVADLEVGPAATDCAEIHIAVVGVTCHDIGCCCQEQVGRCDLLLAAEGCHTIMVDGTDNLADKALFGALGQVGGNLAGSLTCLQLLGKELLCLCKLLALLGLLLVGDIVEIGVALSGNVLALEHVTDLVEHQVGRPAVKQQMMHIDEQVRALGRLDHLAAVQWRLLQVERLHKVVLVLLQLVVCHALDGHLHRHRAVEGLDDGVALGGEVHVQLGMRLKHTLHGLCKLLSIDTGRIAEQIGNVIDGGGGILQALIVDSRLGV